MAVGTLEGANLLGSAMGFATTDAWPTTTTEETATDGPTIILGTCSIILARTLTATIILVVTFNNTTTEAATPLGLVTASVTTAAWRGTGTEETARASNT